VTDQPDWRAIDRYLAREASPDEARAVEAWAAAPGNAALLRTIRERLGDGGAQGGGGAREGWDVDAAWARVAGRMTRGAEVVDLAAARGERAGRAATASAPAPRARRALAWRVAAAALIAAAGLATWRAASDRAGAPGADAVAMRELVAPPGQRVTDTLPDGSRVTLHAGSRLRYAAALGAALGTAAGARDVQLEGEGYFEVTHDERRPFRVRAGEAVAQDLGTRFVVRAYPELDQVEVVVEEGLVSLHRAQGPTRGAPGADSAVIRPGQLGRLGRSGAPTVEPAGDVSRWIGWTAGTLALDGGTLGQALPRFERWYDVDVVLADQRLASRQVVARFRNETLPQALDQLAVALGARYTRAGRTVTFHARTRE
jgi:transmembrane sensor